MQALSDPDPNLARDVLGVIAGRVKRTKDVGPLVQRFVALPQGAVRSRLAEALLRSPAAIDAAMPEIDRNLRTADDKRVQHLLHKLRDCPKHAAVTRVVAGYLVRNKDRSRRELWLAIDCLSRQTGERTMLPALEALSSHPEARVRQDVVLICLQTGEDWVRPVLRRLAKDPDQQTARMARAGVR